MTKKIHTFTCFKKMPLILALALLLATACSKPGTDEYYQPPLNPDGTEIVNPGEVIVHLPSIPGMPEVLPAGSTTTVKLTNQKGSTYLIPNDKPTDMEAGEYTTIISTVVPDNGSQGSGITTLPQGVLISHKAITLPTEEDGRVPNLPLIFAGADTLNVLPNVTTYIHTQRHPMTRAVVVEITLSGISPTKVKSISANLYGVMSQRTIAKSPATRSVTDYYTGAQTIGDNAGKWTTTLRLLGIATQVKQMLHVLCQFDNNDPAPYVFKADVTDILKGFNQGSAYQPAQLKVAIDFSGADVSGSITGWTPGVDEDINVDIN